jgi:hypothetical protein
MYKTEGQINDDLANIAGIVPKISSPIPFSFTNAVYIETRAYGSLYRKTEKKDYLNKNMKLNSDNFITQDVMKPTILRLKIVK